MLYKYQSEQERAISGPCLETNGENVAKIIFNFKEEFRFLIKV
jgi:hypothetical protein